MRIPVCIAVCTTPMLRDEQSSDSGKSGGKRSNGGCSAVHVEFRESPAQAIFRGKGYFLARRAGAAVFYSFAVVAGSVSRSRPAAKPPLARWFIMPLDDEDSRTKGVRHKGGTGVGKFSRGADQVPVASDRQGG